MGFYTAQGGRGDAGQKSLRAYCISDQSRYRDFFDLILRGRTWVSENLVLRKPGMAAERALTDTPPKPIIVLINISTLDGRFWRSIQGGRKRFGSVFRMRAQRSSPRSFM